MPRPGPRPYECVKRAWHSERHQPMRGSIIQQIFRVAHDTHSTSTKKNKEWQEKLPLVVLKAEEIMYSKANSEAEYMNPDTLWDRINDAINTIIRRDESAESGNLLPPCIEAALNLGCVPVRTSRSQRHCSSRTYLTPITQEVASLSPRSSNNSVNDRCSRILPVHPENKSNFVRSANVTPGLLISEPNVTNLATSRSYPLLYDNSPRECNRLRHLGSTYPLYYGNHHEKADTQARVQVRENVFSNTVLVGTPIRTSVPQAVAGFNTFCNLVSNKIVETSSDVIVDADMRNSENSSGEKECDLSLRLGLSLEPCPSAEGNSVHENKDFRSSYLRESKSIDYMPLNKKTCFLQPNGPSGPCEPSSVMQLSKDYENRMEATIRKRKAVFGDDGDDRQFHPRP